MLESLITSKTRIKLLLKFFLNINNQGYLRSLEAEFNESTNGIRQELNRFEHAGLLLTESEGNKKLYRANTGHPLFKDLNSIILKFVGVEELIERVIDRLGNVQQVYLEGRIAQGLESDIIDLLIVGDDIDRNYLSALVEKTEPLLKRKIRYLVFNESDAEVYVERHFKDLVLIFNSPE
ncbi:ArsR family transcriptional regulator [Daejeonella sp.]|uniref:ArsR family transcriptional regulator n=1 Tax=Daejeonella sp. TaxID=2805397 RepID=UPI0025C1FB7A|nr:ArsR family transcriptional regulator [Daejeonella sp.]